MIDSTAAEQTIRERIRRRGRITFAEFMRTALYHPVDGYYTSEKPFGAAGDYYTSPAAHPAFGALLAIQLFEMWRCLGSPPDFTVVEMGAGNGMLADDICAYVGELSGEFARRLKYMCIDRYPLPDSALRPNSGELHIERLMADKLPLIGVRGCFISNEFVDAFPVNRFQVVDGELLEMYVALDNSGEFVEALDRPSTPLLDERVSGLGFALADGQRGEISLHAKPWLKDLARALEQGFLITIDYGYEASELYAPQRRFGTLQTYYRHTEGSSPYQRIGRQDITAHVDFSLLQAEGRAAGLNTLAFTTQAEMLRSLGITEMMQQLRSATLSQHVHNANMMALRELVKPDGLGGFKALIQEKGTGVKAHGDIVPNEAMRQGLTLPLLTRRHMPLMDGRYPHTGWEMPSSWSESSWDEAWDAPQPYAR